LAEREEPAAARACRVPWRLVRWAMRALHTRSGHWLPSALFTLAITKWTGIETLPVALVSLGLALLCTLTDLLIIPRHGPVRQFLELIPAVFMPKQRGSAKPEKANRKIIAKKQ
jgi:hypothetical protein